MAVGDTDGYRAGVTVNSFYVLTVAVSVSAGVFAITSLAATWGYLGLADYRVEIALACIALITIINLRGVKESGLIFSDPTYIFVISMLALVGLGLMRILFAGATPVEVAPSELPAATATLGVLQAFSAGCTALTGVEAISNGVPAFKQPESRNAATTLLEMVAPLPPQPDGAGAEGGAPVPQGSGRH